MNPILPNGEYATSRTPAASHTALSSCQGRLGCACIWFAAGTTFALLSRRWRSGGPKFEIPIARTLPVRSPSQQRAHVQVVIIDPSRAAPPLPPMSLRSSGSRDHERPARYRQLRLGSDRRLPGPACRPAASASNNTSSVYTCTAAGSRTNQIEVDVVESQARKRPLARFANAMVCCAPTCVDIFQ
jgi:hypothetical protein